MDRSPVCISLLLASLVAAACSEVAGPGEELPPSLETATPAAGARDVSVLAEVTLRFGAPVVAATVPASVRLESGGRTVIVRTALADGGRTLHLTPSDPLDFGTGYRVVLEASLAVGASTPVGPASWSFTTEGLPPPAPSPDTMLRHLRALAHDSMAGRGSGSEAELAAARYLEGRFLAYGLEAPAGGMIRPFEAFAARRGGMLTSRNVVARLPGAGTLADEWIVVGGHYDHIGFRGLPDSARGPHNGADDNASGTVMVLEVARLIRGWVRDAGMADADRRSVLFVGFGAEEEGLLGSCHYVFQEPEVPLARTRAMMNFDMVGRLRDVLVVSGQETAAAWPPLVANANAPGLPIFAPANSSRGGTDHACFWQAGVPWLGFFTDFHDEYHTPLDDVALIDLDGMGRIGELVVRALARLMVMPEAPVFASAAPVR